MIKNILLHMDSDPRHRVRLDLAIRLAQQHDARVTGLCPQETPGLPAFIESPVDAQIIQQQRDVLTRQAEALRAEFEEETRRQGVRAEWRSEDDGALAVLVRHARYADLAILPQGAAALGGAGEALVGEVALGAGRPILVIPSAGGFKTLGERVLVAWNGSREATRAVHDALPLLRSAQSVTVFSIDPPDSGHLAGADISAHLAAHGVKATAQRTTAADLDVGDVLLNAVADQGADLLVMGAYGHSRIRELVLGGATRDILRHMTAPVLLSH